MQFVTVYHTSTEPTLEQLNAAEKAFNCEISVVLCEEPNGLNVYSKRKPKTTAKAVAAMLGLKVSEIA